MSNIDEFKKLYNFEFEEIKTNNFEEASEKYLATYKDGKEKGYIPVFLTVDDYLLKTFKITMTNENEDFTKNNYEINDSNKNNLKFLTIFNNEGNLKDNVILVKVPTTKPYEILAYFGMGSEDIATVKYWYEKYGAIPASITYDEMEFYVERPPQTLEETKKLAVEHYAFCYGLLWGCYDTLEEAASTIYKNVQWYFWWN